MPKYKVVMKYPNGERIEREEVFETREDAEAEGLEGCSNYATGLEVLHMSNPGDYPEPDEDDEADYEIIEVDG